jgi:GT2 family glycosyltransferase
MKGNLVASEKTPATVILVTHNSADLVGTVLDALTSDPAGPTQIVVVDNDSRDGTLDLVESFGVDLIRSAENTGFAGGCHLGYTAAREPTIVFLGHDTTPSPGWLTPLVAALEEPDVGAAMATIEDSSHPGHFNTSGGHLTYFGLAWVSDYGKPIMEGPEPVVVPFPSGAAMAIKRETWNMLGGFRREFFMYHEDTDLGWRLRLAGMHSVRVPTSLVSHAYDFSRSPSKMYHLERNRWLMLASNYRLATLALLLPALAVVELGILYVALRDGWIADKLKAYGGAMRRLGVVLEGRHAVRRIRLVGDGPILASMDYQLASISQVTPPKGTGLIGRLLGSWLRFVLPAVRFFDG